MLKSVRQALTSALKSRHVNQIKERLDAYRNELVLRIVVSLKIHHKLDGARQDERFAALDSGTRQLAEGLLDNRNFFTTGISQAETAILSKLDEQNASTQKLHEETVAAIATLQHCLSNNGPANDVLFKSLPTQLQPSALVELRDIQNKVLDFLWFQDIHSRDHALGSPFGHTFSWIFDHDESEEQRWDDLTAWLERENGCYWISGKAGSGKSTLMKYVSNHPKTREYLATWAGDETLVLSSFFFWYSGSALQKSQQGLLRSILYLTLSEFPELIPIVFPMQCRVFARGRVKVAEPSLSELREALVILVTQQVMPLKMCFFIDGIDEYDGDVADLADLLRDISSDQIKLVCSSRPTAPCISAFADFPGLKLESLTRQDINDYVFENLLSKKMIQLSQRNSSISIHSLAYDIVYKASGVFLWVALVTKSLMNGFQNLDTLDDLKLRLDELPSDIEQLYMHMLKRMEPVYRLHAGRLLQIMYHHSQPPNRLSMTTLQMAFANEDNPDAAIDAHIGELEPSNIIDRCTRLEAQIRNCCCGLLEVIPAIAAEKRLTPRHLQFDRNKSDVFKVYFSHKSVLDFLRNPDIWSQLTSTAGGDFNPYISLASSYLRCIKMLPVEKDGHHEGKIWHYLLIALNYCFLAEGFIGYGQIELIEELDAVMDWHWRARGRWHPLYANLDAFHWSVFIPSEMESGWHSNGAAYDSMFTVACRFGLKSYVENVIDEDMTLAGLQRMRTDSSHKASARLQAALNIVVRTLDLCDTIPGLWKGQIAILKLSLERGADPNAPFFEGISAWVTILSLIRPVDVATAETWAVVVEVQLRHGADPNAEIPASGRVAHWETEIQGFYSPLWYIRHCFSQRLGYTKTKTEERRLRKIGNRLQAQLLALGAEEFRREPHKM